MIIRVKYKKGEEVKYVGHLDLMRTFTRCLKRTNIPLEYSKGFNPRIQISFALPLGVGVTTDADYFDLTLASKMNIDLFLSELNSVLPLGLKVLEAKYIEDKKSLMSLVKEAKYEITLETTVEKEQIETLLNEENIIITKESKSKKQNEEIDIKPYILESKVIENEEGKVILKIHSTAGSVNNLNPLYLINIINEKIGEIKDYEIKREELILA
jgi:radical SAM-linked protein